MDPLFKLTHADLADYIRSSASAPLLKRVENLRREDATYDLLFDMIDSIRHNAGIPAEQQSSAPVTLKTLDIDHSQIEGLLSGNATVADGRQFLSRLMNSGSYYRQLFMHLLDMNPQRQAEIISDLGEIQQVRSNRELLEEIVGIKPDITPPKVEKGFQLSEFLRSFGWRFAAAVPALLVLLLVGNAIMLGPLGKFDLRENAPDGYRHSLINATRGATQSQFDTNNLLRQVQSLSGLLVTSSSDYDTSDYEEAIATLRKGGAIADKLRNESIAAMEDSLKRQPDSSLSELLTEARKVTQDYHFYLGIYHLVRNNPGDASTAVGYLQEAQTLAKTYKINTAYREYYYLGLANAFANNKEKAIELLNAIPPSSKFAERAELAIERLGLSFFERMTDL